MDSIQDILKSAQDRFQSIQTENDILKAKVLELEAAVDVETLKRDLEDTMAENTRLKEENCRLRGQSANAAAKLKKVKCWHAFELRKLVQGMISRIAELERDAQDTEHQVVNTEQQPTFLKREPEDVDTESTEVAEVLQVGTARETALLNLTRSEQDVRLAVMQGETMRYKKIKLQCAAFAHVRDLAKAISTSITGGEESWTSIKIRMDVNPNQSPLADDASLFKSIYSKFERVPTLYISSTSSAVDVTKLPALSPNVTDPEFDLPPGKKVRVE